MSSVFVPWSALEGSAADTPALTPEEQEQEWRAMAALGRGGGLAQQHEELHHEVEGALEGDGPGLVFEENMQDRRKQFEDNVKAVAPPQDRLLGQGMFGGVIGGILGATVSFSMIPQDIRMLPTSRRFNVASKFVAARAGFLGLSFAGYCVIREAIRIWMPERYDLSLPIAAVASMSPLMAFKPTRVLMPWCVVLLAVDAYHNINSAPIPTSAAAVTPQALELSSPAASSSTSSSSTSSTSHS